MSTGWQLFENSRPSRDPYTYLTGTNVRFVRGSLSTEKCWMWDTIAKTRPILRWCKQKWKVHRYIWTSRNVLSPWAHRIVNLCMRSFEFSVLKCWRFDTTPVVHYIEFWDGQVYMQNEETPESEESYNGNGVTDEERGWRTDFSASDDPCQSNF